jgi:hypothetical protein
MRLGGSSLTLTQTITAAVTYPQLVKEKVLGPQRKGQYASRDRKIVKIPASLQLHRNPPGLSAPAGPSLRRLLRISVLG